MDVSVLGIRATAWTGDGKIPGISATAQAAGQAGTVFTELLLPGKPWAPSAPKRKKRRKREPEPVLDVLSIDDWLEELGLVVLSTRAQDEEAELMLLDLLL